MNAEMARLGRALRTWLQQYSGGFPSPEGAATLQTVLCENEAALRTACATIRALSFHEHVALVRGHPDEGLDGPGSRVMPDYAEQALDRVCSGEQLEQTDADRTEMLKRVVDLATFAN